MIPGGTVGAHIVDHSKMGIIGSFTIIDDGTYITFSIGGTAYFRIRKVDKQFQAAGEFDSSIVM